MKQRVKGGDLPLREADMLRKKSQDEAEEEEDDWLAVASLENRITPIVVLIGLAAINARGYWNVFTTHGATPGDDLSSHFAEASTFARRIRSGDLNFWFSETQLGYPLFMTYTPLPILVIGSFLSFAPDLESELAVFKFFIMLIWMASPVGWYVGSRGMGLSRLQASLAAFLWNHVMDKQGFGIGINALLGKGLLAHSVACAFLPLWLGAAFSRISSLSLQPISAPDASLGGLVSSIVPRFTGRDATCVVSLALVLMSNSFTAVFSILSGGGMILLDLHRPRAFARGVLWLVLVTIAASSCNLFWMIRFLAHLKFQGGLPFKHWPNFQGNTVQHYANYVLNGELFDVKGFPLVTLCFVAAFFGARATEGLQDRHEEGGKNGSGGQDNGQAVGEQDKKPMVRVVEESLQSAVNAWGCFIDVGRSMHAPARSLLTLRLMFLASFIMMLGRKTLPIVYSTLPFHDDIESVRYTIGAQAAGVMLGGIALASVMRCLWSALCSLSRHPMYRLTSLMTMMMLFFALAGREMDARVQGMAYSKNKSFNFHSAGYADVSSVIKDWKEPAGWMTQLRNGAGEQVVRHSVGGAGGRYMIFKGATTHYTLNFLSHVTGKPGFVSYSRGYHDTLSFWHLEYFRWSPEMFRLYNIRHVVIPKKNTTSIPPYFETIFPKCPKGISLGDCTTKYGHGYSVHNVKDSFGFFELVSAPVVVCTSEIGLKSPVSRYLLHNLTHSMFHMGSLPAICNNKCDSCPAMKLVEGGGATLQVHADNAKYISDESLRGIARLEEALYAYGTYTLEVPGQYRLRGTLGQVTSQLKTSLTTDISFHADPRGRRLCNVYGEGVAGEEYSASIKCSKGYIARNTDVLLFKMSYHPLWSAKLVSQERQGEELGVIHMAPNLIGVPLSSLRDILIKGDEVRVLLRFTTPRDQHLLFVFSFIALGALIIFSTSGRQTHRTESRMGGYGLSLCGAEGQESLAGQKND